MTHPWAGSTEGAGSEAADSEEPLLLLLGEDDRGSVGSDDTTDCDSDTEAVIAGFQAAEGSPRIEGVTSRLQASEHAIWPACIGMALQAGILPLNALSQFSECRYVQGCHRLLAASTRVSLPEGMTSHCETQYSMF